MAGPLEYRAGRPDMSSSPLANMADLSSSDPISPGSPTPAYRRMSKVGDTSSTSSSSFTTVRPNSFMSHNNSHPDPFSANAKASPNSHPSFGKGQLRAKHLRNSPQQLQPGAVSWADETVETRVRERNAQNVFAHHFLDSSDDNLSSDDPTSMFSIAHGTSFDSASSTLGSSGGAKGLGIGDTFYGADSLNGPHVLGEPFREPTSPTLLGKKLRARKFERTQSSSHDPFSAAGGSSARQTPVLSQGSPRAQHTSQRRRLTGTSPKKLGRAASSGQFPTLFNNASDSDEGIPKPGNSTVDMREEVSRIFSEPKLQGRLLLNDKGVTCIDPVIADLNKYVHFPSYSSLLNDDDGTRQPSFSRTPSLSNASDHLAGQSATIGSPSRTRTGNFAKVQGNEGLQIYLANNMLKVLSSALFSATNITMLTLRNNAIGELPAAIGILRNLRELNLSGCGLRYLPAEIQQLQLTTFTHFPNPFMTPPEGERLLVRRKYGHRRQAQTAVPEEADEEALPSEAAQATTAPEETIPMGPPALPMRVRTAAQFAERTSFALAGASALRATERPRSFSHVELRGVSVIGRVLGPARKAKDASGSRSLPTLQELCIRRLLRPEGTKGYNGQTTTYTLLQRYEAGSLSRLRCHLGTNVVKRLEAARRSACGVWGQLRPTSMQHDTWCSGSSTYSVPRTLLRSTSSRTSDVDMHDTAQFVADDTDEGEASAEWSSDEDIKPRLTRSIDVELELDKGDDARSNPWFNRCPNPKHTQKQETQQHEQSALQDDVESATEDERDWPCDADGAGLFSSVGVERIEWVTHVAGLKVASVSVSADMLGVTDEKKRVLARDATCIPLLWRGCGTHCLEFLEDV